MKDKPVKAAATPKVRMEYPQGGNKSAKPSLASQKHNPGRRNRSYTPAKRGS